MVIVPALHAASVLLKNRIMPGVYEENVWNILWLIYFAKRFFSTCRWQSNDAVQPLHCYVKEWMEAGADWIGKIY